MLKMYAPVEQDRSHTIPPSLPPPISTSYPPPAPMSTTAPIDHLSPVTTVHEGRIWSLHVVQQPIRARMCGFGDKDRRPITPPPCIRLIVRDAQTEDEIDINEIDTSFYVLTVDLWDAEGHREVNLVRHSATSPSISTAMASSYPPPPHNLSPTYPPYSHNPYGQPMYQPMQSYYGAYPYPSNSPQQYYPNYYSSQGTLPGSGMSPSSQHAVSQLQQHGIFTRNLIGSLSASAFRLTDPGGKIGVWFILQDLSVRTEGTFRLKINFVNVGTLSDTNGAPVLNHGSAPVLASVFSDPFQVYSAKKFPGVIESTPLSKCFALQGIKIPIRKDTVRGGRGQGGDGGDDDDYE